MGLARRCIGQHGVIIAAATVAADEIVLFVVPSTEFMIFNPVMNTYALFSLLKLTFLSGGRDRRLIDRFSEDQVIHSRHAAKCALFSRNVTKQL